MKYLLLVGDGMGDTPVPALGDKTPLEAAATPAMDELARGGELLLVRTVPPGYPPGSDVANLSLLGYAPEQCYSGRAPLEAASLGVALADDELAFRCNLVTLEYGAEGAVRMVDYSAGHISSDEARELVLALDRHCGSERLRFHPGVSYRHLLVHRGEAPGLGTVPPHDHSGRDVTAHFRRYLTLPHLAELFARSRALLADHPVNTRRQARGQNPANGIWLWGEGHPPQMTTIKQRYGISGALISAVDLLKGLGVHAGLEIIQVPGATGYLDTNYAGKVQAALEALTRHDFVLVHVEAPDETGHQGDAGLKVRAIEEFDARIVAPILAGLRQSGQDFRLVVGMDHYTPVELRTHVDWPVPTLLYDSRGLAAPSAMTYTEANCRAAATMPGHNFDDGPGFFAHLLQQGGA
ncbi:MAG: cofactor-independent phosphoglycerate mutase [Desulfobulbaceae bacterium A2]|nr:MAG: cofactor-independent phosphoglycerate mutase [Desulfobulbaceae bacterium A2]